MRLIHVTTILDFEMSVDQWRGVDPSKEILREFYGPALAAKDYAILSHCWGVAENGEKEVSFQEMEQLVTMDKKRRNEIRGRTGYKKIIDTCKQAEKDGLEWVWIDTCCINKNSSSELSEAINSMYQWYANANQCYAYLHDSTWRSWLYWDGRGTIHSSAKWFTRGWTLQELIAPKIVHFFGSKWERVGDKKQFATDLSRITRIPEIILKQGLHSERSSVAQIMSWAADRTTTREEDRAYSLLGLLGVHMPMLYGEGKNAFRRLQLEIIRSSNDQSIFAWGHKKDAGWSDSFLADDPSYFRDCSDVISLTPDEFIHFLAKYRHIAEDELSQFPAERFRTFTITNDGIQIWLPTVTFGPYAEVKLACRKPNSWDAHCTTMNLAFFESGCFRFFGGQIPNSGPMELRKHFLPYKDATQNPSSFIFELNCQSLPVHGFVSHSVEPKSVEIKDNSITLSKDNDFATVTYVHKQHKTYLAVVPIYFRGRGLVFITASRTSLWIPYLRLHALKRLLLEGWKDGGRLVGHAHLLQSIQHVRAVHTERSCKGCKVTIEVVQCAGCCPSRMELLEDPRLHGVVRSCGLGASSTARYTLLVDSSPATVFRRKSEIRPGGYGRLSYSGHNSKSWCPVNACSGLVADLRKIRLNFSILVGWANELDQSKGLNRVGAIEAAIKFFMDMFGVSSFNNFIGVITFFRELTSIIQTDFDGRPCTRTDKDRQVTKMAQEQNIKALVKYLIQMEDPRLDIEPQYDHTIRMGLWEEAMKWKLGPFAAKLLRVIGTAHGKWKYVSPSRIYEQDIKFIRRKFLSDVQEINKLQETLAEIGDDGDGDNNSNDDQRRALAEDIAGRILLTFWHGISSEVVHVLDKVAYRFLNDEAIMMAPDLVQFRRYRLCNIGRILSRVASSNSDDGLDPLQRMMDDAANGVSKYQIVLAELAHHAALNNASD